MSWDVSRYLHWFMFIHLWKDEVPAFIGGECNGRVGSAQLVQNECCEIPPRRLLIVVRCLPHSRHSLVVGNEVTCRWTYATNVAGLMQSYLVGRFKIFALVHVQSFMER